jgi:hypothetical protein
MREIAEAAQLTRCRSREELARMILAAKVMRQRRETLEKADERNQS